MNDELRMTNHGVQLGDVVRVFETTSFGTSFKDVEIIGFQRYPASTHAIGRIVSIHLAGFGWASHSHRIGTTIDFSLDEYERFLPLFVTPQRPLQMRLG